MKVCDHWREPCGYCPTCQCVTGDDRFIEVPVVAPDGAFTHMRVPASSVPFTATCDDTIIPQIILEPRERSLTDGPSLDESGDAAVFAQAFAVIRNQARQRLIEQGRSVSDAESIGSSTDELPLDESADAAVLAQAKRDYEECLASRAKAKSESCLRFAEIRHQARKKLIEQGHLVDVLRADAALEGSVSNAEDIVESMLLKGGVDEPIAQLTRTVVSNLGRMFLGMGPSHRDIIETSRKLYGDERTPEQKAADRERLMAAAEKLKVKLAKQQAEVKGQTLCDLLESGRMCGGIDKAEGVDL